MIEGTRDLIAVIGAVQHQAAIHSRSCVNATVKDAVMWPVDGAFVIVSGTMETHVICSIAQPMGGLNVRSMVNVTITRGSAAVHQGGQALHVSAWGLRCKPRSCPKCPQEIITLLAMQRIYTIREACATVCIAPQASLDFGIGQMVSLQMRRMGEFLEGDSSQEHKKATKICESKGVSD